jgi:hypothetical protein
MTLTVYIACAVAVFFFSGLLGMAGLGAAGEEVPAALLLNVVNLMKQAASSQPS